jgi:hypothetical protein
LAPPSPPSPSPGRIRRPPAESPPVEGTPPGRGDRAERGHRDERARAALEPLRAGERPPALLVAVAVSLLLALGVILGTLTIHDLSHHGGSLPAGLFLACVLALLAQGMYRRRYWAVLGFQALLTFQIIVTSLALIVASTVAAAALCLASIVLGGWLFWKLIRVMGRIQAPGSSLEDPGAVARGPNPR